MIPQKKEKIIAKKLFRGKKILLSKTLPWATKKVASRASMRPQERRGK